MDPAQDHPANPDASGEPTVLSLGIDVGSVYAGLIALDEKGDRVLNEYLRHYGAPAEALRNALEKLDPVSLVNVTVTGSGGEALRLPGKWVDPVICGIEGARRLVPGARNILSVGGGSFSLTELNRDGSYRRSTLNSACASGTGAFIDQQSMRLQIPPEELPKRAMQYDGDPPSVATRCAVFAKSDMIHLQQEGHSIDAIACGLCNGLGNSTVDGLLNGRKIDGLTVLIGGVMLNTTVAQAVIRRLSCEVVVADQPHLVSALGAAHLAARNGTHRVAVRDLLDAVQHHGRYRDDTEESDEDGRATLRPPLQLELTRYPDFTWADSWVDEFDNETAIVDPRSGRIPVALGLDIGSTSTKAVVLDEENRVAGWVYRKTAGDPVRAVQLVFRALGTMQARGGFTLDIRTAGTTGSGRKMIRRVIGADLAMNEITAHAAAALFLDPEVDTIIELGGQDAKFTQLQNGMVCHSVMNYVCAAGTGSFIEEQAQKLGIPLDEFAHRAMGKAAPETSDRCTVYMERDLDLLLARGWSKDQIAAAVLHSVRDNYLNKVVNGLHIGKTVTFQGATARNRALVAAFEHGLRQPIRVSRFCHLTGALGIALLVRERVPEEDRLKDFKGLDFADAEVRIDHDVCDLCRNRCRLQIIRTGDSVVAWGLKCGRDMTSRQVRVKKNPGFAFWLEREAAWQGKRSPHRTNHSGDLRVGLPRGLATYNHYPYWRTLLQELGCVPVLPPASGEEVLRRGTEIATAEYCAPVLNSTGHAAHLLADETIDWLLVPHMLSGPVPEGFGKAHFCCYVQAHPGVLKSLKGLTRRERILSPVISLADDPSVRIKNLTDALAEPLGVSTGRIGRAMQRAEAAQDAFSEAALAQGRRALKRIEENDALGIVCIGRPYNTVDSGLTLDIPRKVAAMGYDVLYMDMLKYDPFMIPPHFENMYWYYGQKILSAASTIAQSPRLFALFISNFMCGPDSYLLTYFKDIMERAGKPFLCLQFDGHGADAGYLTRIEAALETFHAWSGIPLPQPETEMDG